MSTPTEKTLEKLISEFKKARKVADSSEGEVAFDVAFTLLDAVLDMAVALMEVERRLGVEAVENA